MSSCLRSYALYQIRGRHAAVRLVYARPVDVRPVNVRLVSVRSVVVLSVSVHPASYRRSGFPRAFFHLGFVGDFVPRVGRLGSDRVCRCRGICRVWHTVGSLLLCVAAVVVVSAFVLE